MIAKRDENPVTVRFPTDVLKRITESAKENGRSRNTEIVLRLADSVGMRPTKKRK